MTTMNVILLEIGKKPVAYKLSTDIEKQIEEISATLGGNFISSRLFQVGEGLSLHIFINDMAIPLRLTPNRRFPKPDEHEIIFGNALFLLIDDQKGDEEGGMDIPENISDIFCQKIDELFTPCKGDEKPDPSAEIFVENAGTTEERRFKWEEFDYPGTDLKFIGNGYVRIVDDGICDTFEIKGRYFKQNFLPAESKPIQ